MKKALFLLLFLTGISFAQNLPMKDGFYIGYHNFMYYDVFWQWNNYRDLGVNMMLIYGEGWDIEPRPTKIVGGFFDPLNTYAPQVSTMITNWGNEIQPRTIYTEREKIRRGGYGQQSDYEAEMINPSLYSPGYGYATHQTGSNYLETWQSETVSGWKCCIDCPDASPGGYMVSGLYENCEQSEVIKQFGLTQTEIWPPDYYYSDVKNINWRWFVLPRMRINAGDADANPPKRVVRIEVTKFNHVEGQTQPILSVDIMTNYFKPNGSGTYNGDYIDIFYQDVNVLLDLSVNAAALNDGNTDMDGLGRSLGWWNSEVDYRVYWWGDVDVWLDRVRVCDEWAYYLFYPDPTHIYDFNIKIQEEAQSQYIGTNSNFGYFYYDEFPYNRIPCLAKVNEMIKYWNNNTGLVTENNLALIANYSGLRNEPSYDDVFDKLYSSGVVQDVLFVYQYPFTQVKTYEDPNNPQNDRYTYFPLPPGITLPNTNDYPATGDFGQCGGYHKAGGGSGNKEVYADSLNILLQNNFKSGFGWQVSVIDQLRRSANLTKQHPEVMFAYGVQQHAYEDPVAWQDPIYGALREPTNEEIRLNYYLGLAYGAKQLLNYSYYSYEMSTSKYYNWGMIGLDWQNPVRRTSNYYEQNKWDFVSQLNSDAMALGNEMFDLTWQSGFSVHVDGANHGCITDIKSIYRNAAYPYEFNPANEDQTKYWEMTFFEPSMPHIDEHIKYVMFVNRRCTPETNPGDGDIRQLKIKFNPQSFLNYNNWTICDVLNPDNVLVFNKNSNNYIDLGSMSIFQPGEGRIFKLEPVFQTGGGLVADEYIPEGEEFTCEDTVWTNGYNLTIENGVNIHFSDSAKFVVEGGTFQIGDDEYSGPNNITMDAPQGGSWKGFEFNGATVKIYGVNFSGLANDSISMLSMIDCPLIDLRNNSFSLGTGNNKSAIDISYVNQMVYISNAYIGSNTFSNSSTELPYVKVMAYSGFTTPVIIESNSFTGSSTALFLSNIQGGAIKSNSFSGFGRAVTALTSSLDVFENTITSTGAYGLEALSGTELKMSYAGGLLVGSKNNITNSDSSSYNIYLENSYFLMNEGENIFDVGYGGYHLYGWFPDSYGGEYGASENCYKVASSVVDPPLHYVTLGEQGNQITDFEFTPYLTGCTQEGGEGMLVINLGDGIYDTVGILGQGGSYSSNYIVTPKTIYDSISISMRFRNYANVKSLCLYLLNTYPDSMQSLGALSKLYLAVSKTDTTTQGITDLKTLYENLILNHQSNVSLVKRCNYYVQKCKVLLHQYSSALTGFQQIINNNPASYEGLVARWDYMATSLLMQGQGGSEKGVIPLWGGVDVPMDIGTDGVGQDDDRSPFTKEERKQIKQAVNTALEVSKYTEEKREKVLTELSTRGDVNATRQLKVLKSLGQTVKVEKPKNISEHLKIVSGDIQKVFVNPTAGKNTNTVFIPQEYRLSQNYPNPFNPTTKISYDIPKNSIVKLTIYDILGREVMKLVNNEFKQPGRYVVEFNGTNLASGVYFYRLESGDFVASKKMVLVK